MLQEIILSGAVPRNVSVLRAELRLDHNVKNRRFLLSYIPENSVGAELGVFTGLFSSFLANEQKIARVTFVDPWWKAFGEHYPNWGSYTDHGRLKTRSAFEIASQRIAKPGLPNRIIEVDFSCNWLQNQPDRSLDWVYLDTTHWYEETKRELELLDQKIGNDGMILGDDWVIDPNDRHHGVFLAANEFLKSSNFELVLCGRSGQWMMRRALPDRSSTLLIRYEADALRQPSATNYDQPDYDDPNSLVLRMKTAMRGSTVGFQAAKSLARWLLAIVAMRIHRFCLDALQAQAPSRGRWTEMLLLRIADQSWWLASEPSSFRLVRWAKNLVPRSSSP